MKKKYPGLVLTNTKYVQSFSAYQNIIGSVGLLFIEIGILIQFWKDDWAYNNKI